MKKSKPCLAKQRWSKLERFPKGCHRRALPRKAATNALMMWIAFMRTPRTTLLGRAGRVLSAGVADRRCLATDDEIEGMGDEWRRRMARRIALQCCEQDLAIKWLTRASLASTET